MNTIPGSKLRNDILSTDFTEESDKIIVNTDPQTFSYNLFHNTINNLKTGNTSLARLGISSDRLKSPGDVKNINETLELIEKAIRDYERRYNISDDSRIDYVYEEPDELKQLETISVLIDRVEPASFSKGAPFQGTVKNLVPMLREVTNDPDNPGYKLAILGYWHDNMIQLTCWSRTNKAANTRAIWLENLMNEYRWYFQYSGINQIFYQGRGTQLVKNVNNNKIYGRPIYYYVRTETLVRYSQKELEQIYVNLIVNNE
jgi:hypothetical protein